MIPEAAVEAAAKAMHEAAGWDWSDRAEWQTAAALSEARAALEAAAPHMPTPEAASVWDEAANVLYMGNAINQDHLKAMWQRNPYRSETHDA